jgi:glyoxylase-like metal-dependent hydrolase (beta-lactamase superfamily II)
MREVVRGVRRSNKLVVANVWIHEPTPGSLWLVDTGHPVERVTLLASLRRAGILPRDLKGILLTHRHSDHAGNARFLQQRFGVPVTVHRADAEILAGRSRRPWLVRGDGTALAGLFARIENRFPAAPLVADHTVEDGDEVAGLEVHWMPGHTEGSVFYRSASGVLFTGDTLLTAIPPLTARRGLSLPYPSFASNHAQSLASIAAFHERNIPYETVLPGHGPPLVGGAREKFVPFLREKGVLRG